jgi:hypothetical protein
MKAANILVILAISVFFFAETGLCEIADNHSDEGHCVGCCSLGCCQATPPSNPVLINLNTLSNITYLQASFSESIFSKGIERPPRISHS